MSSTLKFPSDAGFGAEVKRRVLEYFHARGLSPTDNRGMYTKSAVLLAWFGLSYGLLRRAASLAAVDAPAHHDRARLDVARSRR
jgi:hypothetical protein